MTDLRGQGRTAHAIKDFKHLSVLTSFSSFFFKLRYFMYWINLSTYTVGRHVGVQLCLGRL